MRATFRCSGRIPDGPAADPLLKDSADLRTSAGLKERGGQSVVGTMVSLSGAGCFRFISATVSGVCCAIPREVRAARAREYSPSWANAVALSLLRCCCVFPPLPFFFLPLGCFSDAALACTASPQSSAYCPDCHRRNLSLISLVWDEGSPIFGPLVAGSITLWNMLSSTQESSSSGCSAKWDQREVSSLVYSGRTLLGGHL